MEILEIVAAIGFFGACIYLAYVIISERKMRTPPPSERTDVTATRQWVTDIINTKTSTCVQVGGDTINGIREEIRGIRNDWYQAWYYTAPSGAKIARIMWGHEGSSYQVVEGQFEIIEGPVCGDGIAVIELRTPKEEDMASYEELARWCEHEYICGNGQWSPETKYARIGKGNTHALLANLPKAYMPKA